MMRATTILKMTAAALALQANGALAQAEKDYGYTPTLPDFTDELGVRIGSFVLRSEAELSGTYDDNIFITQDSEEEDFILRFAPQMSLESEWSRHALSFSLGAAGGAYVDSDEDNYLDANAGVKGVYDISRAASVQLNLNAQRLHERRGDVDADVAAENPVLFYNYGGQLSGRYKPGVIRVSPFVSYAYTDYDDVDLDNGGTQNNDDRDRSRYGGGVEVGYEFLRGYEAFIRGEADQVVYQDDRDDAGFARDSVGGRALAGVKLNLTRLITGDFGIGVAGREYSDDRLDEIYGVTASAKATWSVTPLTTIILSADREIDETTVGTASGVFKTTGEVEVVHSLRRDLLISAFANTVDQDFEGGARQDFSYGAGLGAEWVLNRNLSVEGQYEFSRRESNTFGNDYTNNQVTIGLKTRY